MSGGSALSIRRHSVELWQDLVLLDVRKSTFQHLTVNWNLNVLEMALKTLNFVQGLSRSPLLFIPRYETLLKSLCRPGKWRQMGNIVKSGKTVI